MGDHRGAVPAGAEHPGAELELVGAQLEDEVVELAGHREWPELHALGVDPLDSLRRVPPGSEHGDLHRGGVAVEGGEQVRIGDGVAGDGLRQRGQGDPARITWSRGDLRRGGRALGDHLVEAAPRDALVDQAPLHRGLAAHPLGAGGEGVGEVAAHPPLVDQPGEPAGAGEDAEQGQLGERHRRGAVVDEQDPLAGERELVATPGGGAVERGDPGLPGVRGGVLDSVAGLVGELAEVHLPRVARLGEHQDVGARAEHLLLPAGDHHRADLRVLEAQPLHRVVELDVDAEVVGVELQLVARAQAAVFLDVHRERGHGAVEGDLPVPVARGLGPEVDERLTGGCRVTDMPLSSTILSVFVKYL